MINDKIIDEKWLRMVSVCTPGTGLVQHHIDKGFKKTPKEVLLFDELTHDERLWIVLRSEFLPEEEVIHKFADIMAKDIIGHFLSSFNNHMLLNDILGCHMIRWREIYKECNDLKLGITKWSVVHDKVWRETLDYIKSQTDICNAVIGMYFGKTIKAFTKDKYKDKQIEQLIELMDQYDKELSNGK